MSINIAAHKGASLGHDLSCNAGVDRAGPATRRHLEDGRGHPFEMQQSWLMLNPMPTDDRKSEMRPAATRRSSQSTVRGVGDCETELHSHSSRRDKPRRLGPLEYTLVALIAVGIAITLAMAILNP